MISILSASSQTSGSPQEILLPNFFKSRNRKLRRCSYSPILQLYGPMLRHSTFEDLYNHGDGVETCDEVIW